MARLRRRSKSWLFIHQHFPGHFAHVVRHLAAAGDHVAFVTRQSEGRIDGVRTLVYQPRPRSADAQFFIRDFEAAIENGLAVFRVCEALKREGFQPDLVIGHNGWGEILYVKDCWPNVPLLGYFEFFYRVTDSDLDFDPEFPPSVADQLRVRTRNAVNLLGLQTADQGQTATEWQLSHYPQQYRRKISVIHEGIDTAAVRPDPRARLQLQPGAWLSPGDQIITYSARNLEPYRGFHVFMRTLPAVMAQFPQARVLIVGGTGVSYGRPPPAAANWRDQLLSELGGQLDLRRIIFSGRCPTRCTSRCCRFRRCTST
jgi:glycosyltransferase involved in cell wall biosynthesis